MPLFRLSSVLALAAACASTPSPKPSAVPESLRVPEGQALLLHTAARGAQIYTCKPKAAEPASFEWALKAPEADLFDQNGAKIGHHYGGPTWESNDGSLVVGEVVQRSAVQGAIPWLLLRAKSTGGSGVFTGVKYIQRVDTVGGVAPASGCDGATAGVETRVDYSASYDFYGAR
jgi:Protein of unknown function (DUF3455)